MTFTAPILLKASWTEPLRGRLRFHADWPIEAQPRVFYGDELLDLVPPHLSEILNIQGYHLKEDRVYFYCNKAHYPHLNSTEPLYLTGDWLNWEPKALELTPMGTGWYAEVPIDEVFKTEERVYFKYMTPTGEWLTPPALYWNQTLSSPSNAYLERDCSHRHIFDFQAPKKHISLAPTQLKYGSSLLWVDPLPALLTYSSNKKLGVTLSTKQTIFRLFAPRATSVELHWELADEERDDLNLQKDPDGVWEITVDRNLEHATYCYKVCGPEDPTLSFNEAHRVLDPYATLIDPEKGLGIIISIPEKKSFFTPPQLTDCIILEGHVKDLIEKVEGLKDKGFKGLTEWIQRKDCYLKTLGINVLELQPLQAFDGDHKAYHWGYMPINYFAIAPDYATDPLKIHEEFKAFIEAAHKEGIAVIVDVVYNHLGNPNHLAHLDKGYYFRLKENGDFENWSGCGNDLRTDTPMAKRLILESLLHWVKCYDVDGFRFDLADLVGKEVLEEVRPELQRLKPGILLIAEPWSFKSHIGLDLKETEWSSWNDGFREFVAKYVKGEGNADGLLYFTKGSTDHLTRYATQSINYVESHDDRTWIDKITENSGHDGLSPTSNDICRSHLMLAILMASRGIPMLSAGQDFLRSKGGISNTYLRGDINALSYERLEHYRETAKYFSDWISLRQSDLGKKHFATTEKTPENAITAFKDASSNACALAYGKDLLFAINPHTATVFIPIDGIDPKKYQLIADTHTIKMEGISQSDILWNSQGICLPPLSLGLFLNQD